MEPYRVGIVGCGRMGGSIDDEVQSDLYRAWRPYSHAAAYASLPQTVMVAVADSSPEKAQTLANRWGVPNRYANYREMIEKENLDIVSITTPGTSHAEIGIFAAEHGVKGIYCEKALCCSLEEADRMRDACQRNGAALNMGTLRRYHPGFEAIRGLTEKGGIGALQSLLHRGGGSLLHTASHSIDTLLYLSGDADVEFVQGLLDSPAEIAENRFPGDPSLRHILVGFRNGLTAHIIRAGGFYDFEAIGDKGRASSLSNGGGWELMVRTESYHFEPAPFPPFGGSSPTVRCIFDLIAAIESGGPGHLDSACKGMEIAVAAAVSHLEDGRRVSLPVSNRSLYIPSH